MEYIIVKVTSWLIERYIIGLSDIVSREVVYYWGSDADIISRSDTTIDRVIRNYILFEIGLINK